LRENDPVGIRPHNGARPRIVNVTITPEAKQAGQVVEGFVFGRPD